MNTKSAIQKICLLVITLAFALSTRISAQPCGLDVSIEVQGGTATCIYFADTSNFLPGWIGYNYVWEINDRLPFSVPGSPVLMYDRLDAGFNRVKLKVYGTNPSTGDSCMDEYTNIFQATGDAVYPEFDVTVSGNTVNFYGSYKGGSGAGNPVSVQYDFGDGSPLSSSNSFFETHTYASTGIKSVYLIVGIYNPNTMAMVYGQFYKYIDVGPSVSNLELTLLQDNTICDSVLLLASSTPPFTISDVNENFNFANGTLTNGAYTHVPMADVPGHDFIGIEASAAGSVSDINHYLVTLNDCGILPDTVSGYVFEDLNFNGLKDAGEPGFPGATVRVQGACNATSSASIQASYSTITDSTGFYSILVPHYLVSVYLDIPNGYTLTFPQSPSYTVNYTSGTMHPGHIFGLSALSTHICGRTYLDENNDSLYNSGERPLPGVLISALQTNTGITYHSASISTGIYCFDLPPGTYILKENQTLLDSAVVNPDSIIVAATSGGYFNSKNFGFRSPVPTDFHLSLSGINEARPGFDFNMGARVNNSGFQKGKGLLVLNYDAQLTVLNVHPAGGIINTSANTITWNTDSLSAGGFTYYSANFNIPASTPLGTLLNFSASITALPGTVEYDLSDNTVSLVKTVIGSFDPNDKMVSPEGIGAAGAVLHATRFDYRIRFQNTGTASAIHVIVVDTLDQDLDIGTLQMLRSSHSYDLVINGRILTWRFFNIHLPDSTTNEPGSHGFIEFSISAHPGLADGTSIENTAAIYFDFNAPVITNTTLNTVWTSLASTDEIGDAASLLVYPNPGSGNFFLVSRMKTEGQIVIELFELTGKKVRSIFSGNALPSSALEIRTEDLYPGVYIISVRHQEGVAHLKWTKQ